MGAPHEVSGTVAERRPARDGVLEGVFARRAWHRERSVFVREGVVVAVVALLAVALIVLLG